MTRYSTNEVGKKLGITPTSLVRYMKAGKIPLPEVTKAGRSTVHSWTEEDIERVRKLLPTIANGRKTRWQRQRDKDKKQAKASKPKPVSHKKK